MMYQFPFAIFHAIDIGRAELHLSCLAVDGHVASHFYASDISRIAVSIDSYDHVRAGDISTHLHRAFTLEFCLAERRGPPTMAVRAFGPTRR